MQQLGGQVGDGRGSGWGVRAHAVLPGQARDVYAVSSFLVQHSANILASQQYGESPDGRFFMRVHFSLPPPGQPRAALERGFSWVAEAFHMDWQLHDRAARVRTLIMVSRLGHCLNDLLFRAKTGSLPVDVVGVASNHDDYGELAASYRIPFHHIPVTPAVQGGGRGPAARGHRRRRRRPRRARPLHAGPVRRRLQAVEGRMINIHHSFLPSFKGAKPYHQAHARGVKLVGATAHYVTPDSTKARSSSRTSSGSTTRSRPSGWPRPAVTSRRRSWRGR